jgi:hypothetical protein
MGKELAPYDTIFDWIVLSVCVFVCLSARRVLSTVPVCPAIQHTPSDETDGLRVTLP